MVYKHIQFGLLIFPTAALRVMFNSSTYSGAEADGIIPVTVVATGTASIPYTVIITPLEPSPRSARAEVDYSNEVISVVFNPGETEKTVDVDINPDCLREGLEFFNLSLSPSSNASSLGVGLGDPSEAIAEIEDTDGKFSCYSIILYVHELHKVIILSITSIAAKSKFTFEIFTGTFYSIAL